MKNNLLTYSLFLVVAFFCLVSFFAFDQMEDTFEKIDEEISQFEEEINQKVEVVIPPLVQKELDIKLDKYKQAILDKCREKALEAAEIYIDSLVSEEIKLQASDTLKFPAKPIRPILREPVILNDSTSIAPIIK